MGCYEGKIWMQKIFKLINQLLIILQSKSIIISQSINIYILKLLNSNHKKTQKKKMHPTSIQNKQPKKNSPYSLKLFEQTYKSASTRLIQFFTIANIKKYIEYDSKSKFHKELIEEVLRQLRQFLRNKAMRDFESLLDEEKLEEKLGQFDQIYFRKLIFDKIRAQSTDERERKIFGEFEQFQVEDVQDQILDQIQAKLVKMYAEL